jgi:hypothetical protein
MLAPLLLILLPGVVAATQQPLVVNPEGVQTDVVPPFRFSEDWQILGPFQVGTRGTMYSSSCD